MTELYCPACGEATEHPALEDTVLTPEAHIVLTCTNCLTMWDITMRFEEVDKEDPDGE